MSYCTYPCLIHPCPHSAPAALPPNTFTPSPSCLPHLLLSFAALQQPELATTKSTLSATHSSGATHDREHEHIARTLHVVLEPNAADMKYCIHIGTYPQRSAVPPCARQRTTPGRVSAHDHVQLHQLCSAAPGPHVTAGIFQCISIHLVRLRANSQSGCRKWLITLENARSACALRYVTQQA
jgi:hypothetical protein